MAYKESSLRTLLFAGKNLNKEMEDFLENAINQLKIMLGDFDYRSKVYERPDDFKEKLKRLTDLLDFREASRIQFRALSPEKQKEQYPAFIDMDQKIDRFEHYVSLLDEYYQLKSAVEAELEKNESRCNAAAEELMIHLRKEHPEEYEKLLSNITGNMNETETEELLDRLAIREFGLK